MKGKLLILICLILFIVSVSCVSATQDLNQTINDDTNVLVSDGDTLSVSSIEDEIGDVDDGTFRALQKKIDNAPEGSTIILENDYLSDGNKISINKTLTIDGNYHTFNGRGYVGGGTYSSVLNVYSDNVVIKNLKFKNCNSQNAGAIYWEGDYGTLSSCNFYDNQAEFNGGAVYWAGNYGTLSDCVFTNNYAKNRYGAAVFWQGNNGILNNSSFNNNVRNSAFGVVDWEGDDGKLLNSQFDTNTDPLYWEGEHGTLENSNFTKTLVVWTSYANYGVLNNCNFINNNAGNSTSRTLLWNGNNGLIKNSNFIKNTGDYGGVLQLNGEYGSVDNCTFKNNSVGTAGAVYLNSGYNKITNSSFINNMGGTAGALYFNDYCFNNVKNCEFIDNSANDGAGAIYFNTAIASHYSKNYNSNVSDCIFENNLPYDYGGGVSFIENNTLEIKAVPSGYLSEYTGNVSVKIKDKTFDAVLTSGEAQVNITGLSPGTYDAKIIYSGNAEYYPSQFIIPLTIESYVNLEVPDVTKEYGGPQCLEVTLTERGSPVAGADVNINLNGIDYTKTTDSEGKAALAINLNAGTYDAVASYLNVFTDSKVTVNLAATKTALYAYKNTYNSVTLTAAVSPATNGDIVFTVNGKNQTVKVSDSRASYTLNNLAVGSYDAKATYKGDVNHKPSTSYSVEFSVDDVKIYISAPDLTKYYRGPERFVITVTDDNKPVVGKNVSITVNGVISTRKTDANGQASMAINLNSGVYNVTSEYNGIKAQSTITVKSTVSGNDMTKIFRNATQYYAEFVDTKGNLMKNTDVSFNINGVFYTRTTNASGVARMNINLNPGTYIITAENPNSTEKYTNVIKVLPSIVENHDLTKYYKNASKYTLRILGDDGKPVGQGVEVKLNINGVFYTRTTNASGYMALNINLPPQTYIVTAEYNGLRASNNITVLSVLETKDLKMSYRDGSKFEAKILDGQGKPYAGQSVTFNINGVFYKKATGADGVARLNINLIAGEYIITSSYNGLNAANKVTISG
ncbi:MAG: Ig-like domain repeat protein [Methanobrevibacter sp.]|nr:Ig-like domain repeat protein [Methanobrevibacter sp.]